MTQAPNPRPLTYRPHVRWLYYGSPLLALLILVVYLLWARHLLRSGQTEMAYFSLIIAFLLPLLIVTLAHFIWRPYVRLSVQVLADRMILNRGKRVTEIPYAQVERVELRSNSLQPSFILHAQGERIRFSSSLERCEYLLDALASAEPGLLAPDELARFRISAVLGDHSWARAYQRLKQWVRLLALYVVLPVGLAIVFKLPPIGVVVISLIAGMVSYTVFEVLMLANGRVRLVNNPLDAIRDNVYEARMFRFSDVMHVAITSLAVLVF